MLSLNTSVYVGITQTKDNIKIIKDNISVEFMRTANRDIIISDYGLRDVSGNVESVNSSLKYLI